jgi:Flp pilus assembly protein TadD
MSQRSKTAVLRSLRPLLCCLCVAIHLGGSAVTDPPAKKKAAELYEQAGKSLVQSLRLDPQQPRAAKMLGVCYQILGDLKQAEVSFADTAHLDGDDPETWFFLGRVYYLEHSFDKAQTALQKAERLNSRDPQVHELLALIFETIGDTEGALGEFTQAVRWNNEIPKPLSTPHLSYGVFLHKLNRTEESEGQLRIAAKLNPKDWMAHFELGKLLFDLDRFEAAVQELTVASQMAKTGSGSAARVYRLLGRTYYRMGREDDARRAIAMAGK